jgi:hypothetical protein
LSKVAVSRVCNVNPSWDIGWDELYRDGRRFNSAFVPEDVYVIATGIDKRHSCFVHMRLASVIVSFIVGHRAGRDDNQALSRVRVPTGTSSGRPDIVLNIYV